ncbi:MAG: XRE family transcriptional regulator [Candidatus Binataceae bacterium]
MSTVDKKMGDAEFRARLVQVMERFGSVAGLARAVGISDNAIYKWLAGRGQPSVANLIALARTGGVSLEWLATGKEPAPAAAAATGPANRGDFIFMPRNRLRPLGGRGAPAPCDQVVDYLAFRAQWALRRLGVEPRDLLLIEIAGDSMAPTIESGDLVLADLGEPRFRQDGAYLIRHAEGLSVKRLQRRPDGKVMLRSDNPAYAPIVAAPESIAIVGRVIWVGGPI